MQRMFKIGLFAALVAALLIAVGCSDDDPVGPVDKQVGNMNNPDLLLVTGSVAISELYADQLLDDILDVLEGVFERAALARSGNRAQPGVVSGIDADSMIILTYDSISQYWYWDVQIVDQEDTLTINDSIQFLHATGPVKWPDSTLLTGLHTGAGMRKVTELTNEVVAAQLLTVMGDIVNRGDVTLNGTQSVTRSSTGDSCTVIVELSRSAADVVMSIAPSAGSRCPESGVLSSVASISIECSSLGLLSYDNSFTIVQTFTGNDTYDVVVEDAITRWTFPDSCAN